MRRRFFGWLPIMVFALASPVQAESAANFLKSLAGTWRGSGTVFVSEKLKNSKVRCRITGTFDAGKRRLLNKGRCATAQKKISVRGAINYSGKGNQVSGSYVGAVGDSVITRSGGVVKGTRLTLNTTFQDRAVNKIIRTRSVIRRLSTGKFTITLFEKEGGSYINRGKITFRK